MSFDGFDLMEPVDECDEVQMDVLWFYKGFGVINSCDRAR
jgi:hypothetical protein